MAGEKVHLTKEKETLLITVDGKALESRLPQDRRDVEVAVLTRLRGRQCP